MGERTGWRDQRLSLRHRVWGPELCATDVDQILGCYNLDLILIEYKSDVAYAIIEYKHIKAKIDRTSNQYKVLKSLVKKHIAVFIVRYCSDFSRWVVIPLNCAARKYVNVEITMTERQYVELLYKIRNILRAPIYFDKLFSTMDVMYNKRYNRLPAFLRRTIEEYDRQFNHKIEDELA